MFTNEIDEFLNSEMEEVTGGTGAGHTCVCENGGAGAVIRVSERPVKKEKEKVV